VKVPEQDNRLVFDFFHGDEGFERIVGGVVGAFFRVDQAIHDRPEDQVVLSSWAICLISASTVVLRAIPDKALDIRL